VNAPASPVVTQNVAARTAAALRGRHPSEVLGDALARFPGRIALVSSFGAESAVLLHMVSRLEPSLPVLFLDTGQLFAQTLDYRRSLAARLGLTGVRDLRPTFADLSLTDSQGVLWRTDTDACCHVRKVAPLERALGDFDAWITGRKRFHGGARLRLAEEEEVAGKVKFNPLAGWTRVELGAYAAAHDLPAHPLTPYGYASVGCWPCTQPVTAGEDVRAGRWSGLDKTECGIHTPNPASGPLVDLGDGL